MHVLCNNAGVSGARGADNISLQDWRWTIDVNLMGGVHGLKAFLPLLRSHGEGGHVVNTASMAGFLAFGFGAYAATKFAVVGISEALAMELEPQGIGVSVLCPGWVATHITESRRNLPKATAHHRRAQSDRSQNRSRSSFAAEWPRAMSRRWC